MRTWKMVAVGVGAAMVAAAAPQQQDTTAKPAAAPQAAAAPASAVTVEIVIGKNVADRMPTDTASAFPADVGSLVCWTKVTGAAGQKITHTWTHGPHTDVITLSVGGSPWRTYSRRTMDPSWTGEWTVTVKDEAGNVIGTKTFTVGS